MKILALRLFNVKRFANSGVAIENIGDGVNVLCAGNEFGKSTSFEALHALFFSAHSSSSADVRSLRPYSGGGPVVEVDLETAEGNFRITKQYLGSRSARVVDLATGRLIAQADEAENVIARLIGDGASGPAGLLWVRQGVTGIERRSKSEEDGERDVRRSLLESVQGEVEAITGGRRMAEIMDVVTSELEKLVTKRGPKAGGAYAIAIEKRDRLAEDERKLSADVATLQTFLETRALHMKQLAELENDEEKVERRKAIESAQVAFDAARSQRDKLNTAQVELELARELRDANRQQLDAFRTAARRAGELSEVLRVAQTRRANAADERRAAAEAIETAQRNADAADAGEQDLRGRLSRIDAAIKAREAAEQLTEMNERLAQAEALRRFLEEGEARLNLVRLPANAVDELQNLEVDIATLRAAEQAARPSVAVAYHPDARGPVTMDGTALAEAEERGYHAQAELSVPGIGTITLRSNRPVRNDGRLESADAKRRTLLASMGVRDLADARDRQVRAQNLDNELREARGRLSLLAPNGISKLREDVTARMSSLPDDLEIKEDPGQVRAAFAEAEERRKQTQQLLREAAPRRNAADELFVVAETEFATLNAENAHIEAMVGPLSARADREHTLVNAQVELDRKHLVVTAHLDHLKATSGDLDSAAAVLQRARSIDAAADQRIRALREELAGLTAEIRARSEEAVEEKWRETTEALSVAIERVKAFDREVATLQRLASALEYARSQARELYLQPVVTELRPLLGLLFDDVSITFDEKTLLPQTLLRRGQEEDVERLSGGMREQLSVMTRLAFARLLAKNGRPAPVILDDALVYSDHDRIEKMFDALHRQSRDLQIIVFSCRQRAFQKLGGNVLQMIDWQP